ncbi:hypothetical protein [Lysobacter xanthus]
MNASAWLAAAALCVIPHLSSAAPVGSRLISGREVVQSSGKGTSADLYYIPSVAGSLNTIVVETDGEVVVRVYDPNGTMLSSQSGGPNIRQTFVPGLNDVYTVVVARPKTSTAYAVLLQERMPNEREYLFGLGVGFSYRTETRYGYSCWSKLYDEKVEVGYFFVQATGQWGATATKWTYTPDGVTAEPRHTFLPVSGEVMHRKDVILGDGNVSHTWDGKEAQVFNVKDARPLGTQSGPYKCPPDLFETIGGRDL